MPIETRLDLATGDVEEIEFAVALPDAKAALKSSVKAAQEAHRLAGWEHDFGGAGVHRLDLRDADDKANWILLLTKAGGMVAAGAGAGLVKLRTAANVTIEVPATIARDAMLAFLAWGEALLGHKWELDEAIDAAPNLASLAAIDPEAGWP